MWLKVGAKVKESQNQSNSITHTLLSNLGADLPITDRGGHHMVASADRASVYRVGGYGTSNQIFKYYCPDAEIQNCQWQEMETRLQYGRIHPVAMTIPDNLAKKLCD